MSVPGTIYLSTEPLQQDKTFFHRQIIDTNNLEYDIHLINKVALFRESAERQNLTLIVDMVPCWKAWILRHVLRMSF